MAQTEELKSVKKFQLSRFFATIRRLQDGQKYDKQASHLELQLVPFNVLEGSLSFSTIFFPANVLLNDKNYGVDLIQETMLSASAKPSWI